MTSYMPSNSPVFSRVFAPALAAYEASDRKYSCTELTDADFLQMGFARVLSESTTGRDFLQRHADHGRKEVSVDLSFKALRSVRRTTNLASVNVGLCPAMEAACTDPFAAVPELADYAVYAGDGHYHGAAAHDPRMESSSGGLRKYATGHFFTLDLRTHHARHLATAEQGHGRKCEHDMRAIKRTGIENLRCGQPKGRKVIIAWDPAGIDCAFWLYAKSTAGLYFISRQKDTMILTVTERREIDRGAPENTGVVGDEVVMPASGIGKLRRITYTDATTGETYTYITTEMKLPPWVLALIYKQRWDIEKVFDEFKNKLLERKSWASGETAKTAHAHFLCLTHNLMVLLGDAIERESGVTDDKEIARRKARMDAALEKGASFVATLIQRFTVRCLKFIRWLRNHLYREAPWEQAVERLRHVYAFY